MTALGREASLFLRRADAFPARQEPANFIVSDAWLITAGATEYLIWVVATTDRLGQWPPRRLGVRPIADYLARAPVDRRGRKAVFCTLARLTYL